MRITIVGPGRLGRTFARWLGDRGADARLVGRGEALPSEGLALLTVPDGALAAVAAALPIGPIVLHCSGASDLGVLRPHRRTGSLHPLMSFPGPEIELPDPAGIPVALDGGAEALEAAGDLSRLLGFDTFRVPGDRRLYHAAAVLSGNLLTVLACDAVGLLRAAGVAPEVAQRVWLPLALGSLRHVHLGLAAALTGPVARRDRATLDAHAAAMREAGLAELADAYEALVAHATRAFDQDRRREDPDR